MYKGDIFEDSLNLYKEKEVKLDIESEVLFKDDLVEENKKAGILEESLEFMEPVKPVNVSEEVLFNDSEEIAKLPIEESKIISDELIEELTATEILENVLDSEVKEKQKVIKKPFVQKIFEAEPIVLQRYQEIKIFMLSYKGVKSRISNTADTFNMGRLQLIKLAVSGKSLKLYLNLNYEEVETRLKCKNASMKKAYSSVPVFLRIRSPRSMRNAKYLLNQLVKKHDLQLRKKIKPVDCIELLKQKAK